MKKVIVNIAMTLTLLIVGCSTDTPTQVPVDNSDVLAKLVAGAAGYESNGLAATVNDLVVAGTGGTVRSSVTGAPNTAVVVTKNDSIFDPLSRTQILSLACERNRADTYSEWELSYRIRFGEMVERGALVLPSDPENAETHTSGTFRNASLKVQGESAGRIGFEPAAQGGVALSGSYRWEGSAVVVGDEEERYDDVTITFNWSKLSAVAGTAGNGGYLNGRCDVSISANGPDGVISRNGTLLFSGGESGLLAIGGKRYTISVHGAEVLRKG